MGLRIKERCVFQWMKEIIRIINSLATVLFQTVVKLKRKKEKAILNMKCHFLKAFGLSDQWRQPINGLKSITKMGHSHKQLLIIIGPNWHFCAHWSEKAWCGMQIRANSCECSDHWIHPATFVCAGQPQADKSGTNSSLSTHYIIIDGSCLGLVHFFSLIRDKLQQSESVIPQQSQQRRTPLSPCSSIDRRTFW